MDDYQKPDKLEKAESKLYSTNSDIKRKQRRVLSKNEYDIDSDWDDANGDSDRESLKKKKTSSKVFNIVLIIAAMFFIASLAYASFIFLFQKEEAAGNVDISINSQISVSAGEEFTFDVIIQNNNNISMETVDLSIEYPDGTRDGKDVSVSLPRERNDIGSIDPGTFLRETRTVFLFGEEGETKEFDVKIFYRTPESNAVFEKKKTFEVVLQSTPVRMNLSSVKEITAGQSLEFDLELISNSNETLDNVLIKADYPFGFRFISSTLDNQLDNDTWLVDKIGPREKINFKIVGELQGQNNEEKYFGFSAGLKDEESEDIAVVFSNIGKTLEVTRPFLEIDFAIKNNNSNVINLQSDTNQRINLSYKNNTGAPVRDVEIVVQLDGEVLDEGSVAATRGFYNSLDNTVSWDKTTFSKFEQLGVGESGTLELNLSSKSLIGAEKFKNPEITVRAKVKAKRFTDEDVPEEINSEVFKTLRFNSLVLVDANSLYFDGAFVNEGPIPPKAEQTTTYTVDFAILNSSNRLSGAMIKMRLPNYVSYQNKIWPNDEGITYSSDNREVIWRIGEIKENVGFSGDKVRGAFQVSITPSVSQIGTRAVLASGVEFIATDLFTGEQIRIDLGQISTDIADGRSFFDGEISR